MTIVTGIGSRTAPADVLLKMQDFGYELGKAGWLLRSGGAEGADKAFEIGCDAAYGQKEIYLPWKGFNDNPSPLYMPSKAAYDSVEKFHPAPDKLRPASKSLMARNWHQIYGRGAFPTNVCICYTTGGRMVGGTSQALRIILAELPNCLILNLGIFQCEKRHILTLVNCFEAADCKDGIFYFHKQVETPLDYNSLMEIIRANYDFREANGVSN